MTLVIAHRGASAAAVENTIEAFELAGSLGADGVELDVRRTADDRLVVHHDAHLPDGRIVRRTRRADLPDHVPVLDDALDACGGMFVNIEIKNARGEPDDDPSHWMAYALAGVLTRRGSLRRWLVSSFRAGTVARVRRIAPAVRTALLCEALGDAQLQHAIAAGHDAIHPFVGGLSADRVRAAHAAGLAVNVWTCDDRDRIAELIGWGVDGICTNVPDVALAVRASVARRADRADLRWTGVAIDCADAEELGAFYADVLGWEISARDDGWLQLRDPDGGIGLNIQAEAAYTPPVWPERPGDQAKMMHLEVVVRDLDAAVAAVLAAGGSEAAHQPPDRDPSRLRVVLDPAGHPFCLFVEGE